MCLTSLTITWGYFYWTLITCWYLSWSFLLNHYLIVLQLVLCARLFMNLLSSNCWYLSCSLWLVCNLLVLELVLLSSPLPGGTSAGPSSSSSGDSGSPGFLPGRSPNHLGSLAATRICGLVCEVYETCVLFFV